MLWITLLCIPIQLGHWLLKIVLDPPKSVSYFFFPLKTWLLASINASTLIWRKPLTLQVVLYMEVFSYRFFYGFPSIFFKTPSYIFIIFNYFYDLVFKKFEIWLFHLTFYYVWEFYDEKLDMFFL